MTTIAFAGGILAADTLCSAAGVRVINHKIHRCGDYVFAGCGALAELEHIRQWLRDGAKPPCCTEKLSDGGSWGIAVHEDSGTAFRLLGEKPVLDTIWDPFWTDGSGRDFALSYLTLVSGGTAVGAVSFAAKLDMSTGVPVDTYDLKTKEIKHGIC
jgi:hypothetical protein